MQRRYLRFVFAVLVVCVVLFVAFSYRSYLVVKEKDMKYPGIGIGDSVNSKVVAVTQIRSISQVLFVNGQKCTIIFARNNAYEPPDLPSFLLRGDSVAKKKGNDTLNVIRNGKSFLFRLGKAIN